MNERVGRLSPLGTVVLLMSGAARAEPFCAGAYADDFAALSVQAREIDRRPEARRPEATFSYCTRNTAIYECVSYGSDGTLRRTRSKAVLHGTAFAYKQSQSQSQSQSQTQTQTQTQSQSWAETFLVTNEHVAVWPAVTSDQHAVEGIPPGCKKISESLVLVDDERDSYGGDDIPVARVVTLVGLVARPQELRGAGPRRRDPVAGGPPARGSAR
jgi:serine protease Do